MPTRTHARTCLCGKNAPALLRQVMPVIKAVAYNFVTERCPGEVMALGINSIREVCRRIPALLEEEGMDVLVVVSQGAREGKGSLLLWYGPAWLAVRCSRVHRLLLLLYVLFVGGVAVVVWEVAFAKRGYACQAGSICWRCCL